MSRFDFWQRWGIDLDDTQFANAWAALGVAQRWPTDKASPAEMVRLAASAAREDLPLLWKFPSPATAPDATSPLAWAEAWAEARQGRDIRLRVEAFPDDEPVLPWLRLLHETRPPTAAVSFDLRRVAGATGTISWPLRLGYLPGNDTQSLVHATRGNWPADSLTTAVELSREQSGCDVLVYRGPPRALLRDALGLPARLKTSFLLLLDAGSEEFASDQPRLHAACRELHASGYALVRAAFNADDAASQLNQLVNELSHDSFFDVAVAASFGHRFFDAARARSDLCAAYARWLANFRISALASAINEKVQAMPAGTEIDLSALGSRSEWRTRGVGTRVAAARATPPPSIPRTPAPGARITPPAPPAAAPGSEDGGTRMAARELELDAGAIPFDHESDGGSTLARVAEAVESADVPADALRQRADRFLQQESFVRRGGELQRAAHGFIAGKPAVVRVCIGPPDEKLDSLPTAFPEQALPRDMESWSLDLWLTEPTHLPEPLKRSIELPREGRSDFAEFIFKPRGKAASFEGRITVMHRGRVIQTAVLRASVQADAPQLADGAAPRLEDHIRVRQSIGNLKDRRRFDLAFVLNHTSTGEPRSVALSANRAWISNLTEAIAVVKEISANLTPVAKSAADFAEGIRGEKGRALLVQLARSGVLLRRFLVRDQLNAAGNQPGIAREEYVQVVSTSHEAAVPFEFIYDFDAPEKTARLCAKWVTAIDQGKSPGECTQHTKDEVCPMGFWGLKKVIERHQVSPEHAATGRVLFLQSEPSESRPALELDGISVFGASNRVPAAAIKALSTAIRKATGKDAALAKNWAEWVKAVKRSRPKLLIALAHSDGRGTNAGLEIGGEALEDVMVTSSHVLAAQGDPSPLVALLGCDTVSTTEVYGNHARTFRGEGAAIVIGTIATVLGEHAAQTAASLVAGLLARSADAPTRVGEALRAIKRQALLDKQMMPLCLVAYGDADWQIRRR